MNQMIIFIFVFYSLRKTKVHICEWGRIILEIQSQTIQMK